jgi:hypothetical protein
MLLPNLTSHICESVKTEKHVDTTLIKFLYITHNDLVCIIMCILAILSFCSTPDCLYYDSFVYVIEKVPLKRETVEKTISKVLAYGSKMARSMDKANSPIIGTCIYILCKIFCNLGG